MSDNPQGLTAEEIDRLAKLEQDATAIPWDSNSRCEIGVRFVADDQSNGMLNDHMCADNREDAAFVVALRNAAPALIAAAKRAASFQTQVAELSDKLNGTPCAEIRFSEALAAANARIAELEEALRPFAEANVELPSYIDSGLWLKILSPIRAEARIMASDFRRAARLLPAPEHMERK